jgi:ankyrin repeat protein
LEVPRLMHPLIAPMVPKPANADAVMQLIEEGNPIWIHAMDHLESSPIHWASKRGLEPVVRSLLQRGADPTVTNSQNDTPLHWALQRGHVNIARLLLEHGADLHAENYSHKTPLDYAIVHNRTEFIPELVLFISDFS